MTSTVIATGSSGNAVLYHNEILVDVGIAYKHLEQYLPTVKYILLTHEHSDHYKPKIIQRIAREFPEVKFIGADFMTEKLEQIRVKNYYTIEPNKWYLLGDYRISAVELYHNVPNVGYRIFKDDYKIFHATDTGSLEGITAIGYQEYLVEHNHYIERINNDIEQKLESGEYCHGYYSRDNHLSFENAEQWLSENNTDNGKVTKLHISSTYGKED